MENENTKQIKILAEMFDTDKIVTSDQIEQVLTAILEILVRFKKENQDLNDDTKTQVESIIEGIFKEHDRILASVEKSTQNVKSEATEAVEKALERLKEVTKEVLSYKAKDGESPDQEKIIEEVLTKIKLPEYEIFSLEEKGEKIVSEINALPTNEDDYKIDASHIKNLPTPKGGYSPTVLGNATDLNQSARADGYAIVWDDTAKNFKFAAGGSGGSQAALQFQDEGSNLGASGTVDTLDFVGAGVSAARVGNKVTVTVAGGGGTPGGSDTQVQYNNAGSFGGISGATTNGTAMTFTTGNLIGADVKASGSGGLQLLSSSGTVTALFGAGAGANSTFYGGSKFDYATLSTVPYFDASKNLVSSAVTPTELGYLSGVTSAIQTQINAKGAGTVTSVGWTGGIVSVATATTTPAFTIAGTSGGIPYFSSGSTWATSAALAANALVVGGGAGVAPSTVTTGANVLTALGVAVGSAGAFVTFNGALGTPSSGTVTNLTGTASININGTVGATTPSTGVFTTLVAGSTTSLLLGTAGSAVGNIGFRNATSGTITLAPVAGALGTVTLTLPAITDTLATLAGTETFSNKTLTAPKFADLGFIADANGNEMIIFDTVASAVNEITLANAATTGTPSISATGGDTNISLQLNPKGTGIVKGELKRFMVRLLANTTDTATGTTIGGDYRISNRAITVKAVGAYVDTAGTTNTTTIDINEAGTTILSTKITIDSTEKSSETAATAPVISDTAIAADAVVTFDIDAISTTPAKGLTVWVDYVFQ